MNISIALDISFNTGSRICFLCSVLIGCATFLTVAEGVESLETAPPSHPQQHLGYRNAALLGHSHFFPTAKILETLAYYCGYENHVGTFVKAAPGGTGAPGALWVSIAEGTGIKAHLEAGGVELLGMTYFHKANAMDVLTALADPDSYSEKMADTVIQDYRNWVDLALRHNADSLRRVFVMTPWIPHNKFLNKTDAGTLQHSVNLTLRGVIETLRSEYSQKHPNLEFSIIPAGNGLMKIWDLWEAGQLPEITHLRKGRAQGGRTSAIYTDALHGSLIVYQLNHFLWLTCLFPELDIRKFDYLDKENLALALSDHRADERAGFMEWSVDLRQVAWEVAIAEPFSGITPNSGRHIDHENVHSWDPDGDDSLK